MYGKVRTLQNFQNCFSNMCVLLAIVIVILQQNKLNNYSGGFDTVPVGREALYPL